MVEENKENKPIVVTPEVQKAVAEELRRREAANASMSEVDDSEVGKGGIPPKPKSSFGSGGQIVLMAFVAAVVAFVMIRLVFPSPNLSQYQKDINNLQEDVLGVRQTYALKTDIPSLTSINSQLTSLSQQIATAQQSITTAQNNYNTLSATVNGIKPFDSTSLQSSITKHTTDIATLTTQYNALNTQYTTLKTQIDNIKPTDLTTVNASIATIQTSVTAIQTAITALQTSMTAFQASISTINAKIAAIQEPSIFVVSMTGGFSGMQAVVYSETGAYTLAAIKYTLTAPIVPAAAPTLTLTPFGSVVVGNYVSLTWDGKEQQIVWLVRFIASPGNTTLAWSPITPIGSGLWSINVEVAQ